MDTVFYLCCGAFDCYFYTLALVDPYFTVRDNFLCESDGYYLSFLTIVKGRVDLLQRGFFITRPGNYFLTFEGCCQLYQGYKTICLSFQFLLYICAPARVAKLVDALSSGGSVRKDVLVRIQSRAPKINRLIYL